MSLEYRDRVGATLVVASTAAAADAARSRVLRLARGMWSMPPDHGAAAVRLILESEHLTRMWLEELQVMRERIVGIRRALAAAHPRLAGLQQQHGMFSLLPVSPQDIAMLRAEHAIYMAGSGRINLAGLQTASVPVFARALSACLPSRD